MIVSATRAEAARSRRHYVSPRGAHADVETYMGMNKALGGDAEPAPAASPARAPSPNAYLVCQAPGAVLHPHFHQADQFQVFVAGSGRIGTHAVAAVTVHWAAAHSPYGPVVAGPDGLQYLTLRRQWDPGAQWMPDEAERLRSIRGRVHRTHTSEPIVTQDAHAAVRRANVPCRVTSVVQDIRAAAFVVDLDPGTCWRQDTRADSFVYMLAGTAETHSAMLTPEACLFASSDEGPIRIAAGPAGARLLLAQFLTHDDDE
jgi:hypothetical protein